MGVWPHVAHELHQIESVILDIELARADRNVAGIVPIGDIDITIGQQTDDGRAQKRGVMARHWGNQQHLAGHSRAPGNSEVHQIAKRFWKNHIWTDSVVTAIAECDGANAPIRFYRHARKTALHHLTPSGGHLDGGIGHKPELRIGAHRPRG